MKTTRLLGAALLASSVLLGACDDDDDNGTGPENNATVRFVNATAGALDVGTNGTFATANSNVAFGAGTSCIAIDPSSGTLSFRENGETSTFNPTGFNMSALQPGGTYTVLLSGTTGAYTANVFTDMFTGATSTQGRVRVINTTGDSYGLFVGSAGTMPESATSATFASGTASTWVPVDVGQGQIWFTTGTGETQEIEFTSQAFNVAANGYTTIVVAPPATEGGALRSFVVNACQSAT